MERIIPYVENKKMFQTTNQYIYNNYDTIYIYMYIYIYMVSIISLSIDLSVYVSIYLPI